jgi:hypothetical protein
LDIDYHGPELEDWEFLPGTRVICKIMEFSDGPVALVAVQAVP